MPAAPTFTPTTLSSQEAKDLQFLREEEKLARDVYRYALDKYALEIFEHISQSEQRHMNAILGLLNQYELEDPILAEPGKFSRDKLQTLYDQFIARVNQSEIEALKVGATIEDLDLFDIQELKSHTTNADLLAVYERLECGSRNHMRAFTQQLENREATYEVQYLTPTAYQAILQGAHEACGKMEKGNQGKGKHQGCQGSGKKGGC